MGKEVRVSGDVLRRLVEEAQREPAFECCGLLAGSDGVITELLPARHALASKSAYEIVPEELFRLFREIRLRGLDHLGIYHSHPATENAPSPSDIIRAFYPDVAYFIVTRRGDAPWPVRAFEIRGGASRELSIIEETA